MYGYDPSTYGRVRDARAMMRMGVPAAKPKPTENVTVVERETGTVAMVAGHIGNGSYKVIAEPGVAIRHDSTVGSNEVRNAAERVVLWYGMGCPTHTGEDRFTRKH